MKVVEMMSTPLHTISSGKSVRYASEQMERLKIGSLAVKDHHIVLGIITSRDIRNTHPNRIVADAMTANPLCIDQEAFAWDALEQIEQAGIERLIVTCEGEAIGIVTRETLKIRLSELIDPLTKLFRPAYVQSVGVELISRNEPFHLLFIDLNEFGEINKRHGHPVGDDIICSFASRLKSLMEPGEYLCRYAGDEFVILSRRDLVAELLQKLRHPIKLKNIDVTAAVALVSFPMSSTHKTELPTERYRDLISKASLLSTSIKQTG